MHIAGEKIVNVASLLIFLFTCKEAMAFLTPFSMFRPVTAADVVKSGATLASQVVHHPGWCYRLNIGRLFCCWNKQIINVFMFLSKIIVKQTTYLHQTIRKAAARWNLQIIFFSKWMHFNTSISIFFFLETPIFPSQFLKSFWSTPPLEIWKERERIRKPWLWKMRKIFYTVGYSSDNNILFCYSYYKS